MAAGLCCPVKECEFGFGIAVLPTHMCIKKVGFNNHGSLACTETERAKFVDNINKWSASLDGNIQPLKDVEHTHLQAGAKMRHAEFWAIQRFLRFLPSARKRRYIFAQEWKSIMS